MPRPDLEYTVFLLEHKSVLSHCIIISSLSELRSSSHSISKSLTYENAAFSLLDGWRIMRR
jgi:hypothetical protein